MVVSCTVEEAAVALEGLCDAATGSCVCIGNFDGVHLGHQALLALARQRAEGRPVVAVTFDPHPMDVIKGVSLPRLTSMATRGALLRAAGADRVAIFAFSRETAGLSADDFAQRVLHEALHTRTLVVGYDFSLGRHRSGTPERLIELGHQHGFSVHRLDAFMVDKQAVSSTRIRETLETGDAAGAARLLGRPHAVRGTVIHGQKRGGALLGFPTANLSPVELCLPAPGVYATLAMLPAPGETDLPAPGLAPCQPDGVRVFGAVTNIGVNPTFDLGRLSVETFIMGLDRDLYGQPLEVAFVERLRGEKRFAGPAELAAQIAVDTAAARKLFGDAV